MQRILRRRSLRDLWANRVRYLALAFMLVLSMYLIISIVGAADTVIERTASHARRNGLEDGQFSVFVPLSEQEIREIEGLGVTLEPMFYLDYPVGDGVFRLFKNRQSIDLVELVSGTMPEAEDQIVLERRYCEVNGIDLGQTLSVGGREFTVCGIGTSPDYDAPLRALSDSSVDSAGFGTAFVAPGAYEALRAGGGSLQAEEYVYAYRLAGATHEALKEHLKAMEFDPQSVDDEYFRDYWDRTGGRRDELLDGARDLADGADELRDALKEVTDEEEGGTVAVLMRLLPQSVLNAFDDMAEGSVELADGMRDMRDALEELADEALKGDAANLTHFLKASDNPRIGAAADDQVINRVAGLLAGVILLVLLTYVISVFVVHSIEEESGIIGTLYALGVRRGELLLHYTQAPVIVTFVSGLIGTVLGYSPLGVPTQTADCYSYFSMPNLGVLVEPWLVVYGVALPPLVAAAVNWLVIRKKLSVPALRLIRGERKSAPVRGAKLGRLGFLARFQLRQLASEGRSAAAIWLGMLVTLLVLMMGLDAWTMCEHLKADNIADTRYEVMALYKYPPEEPPEGGSPAYVETLKKELMGYDMDVTVMGLEPDNPYFDARPEASLSRVQVSSSIAQRFALKPGDSLVLSDREQGRDYAFTVSGIVKYSPTFAVFMDIDSMRELFGMPSDYFNAAFSSRELDIPAGQLYSVTRRQDVVNAAGVFVDLMKPMVFTMVGCSALIFAIVMYLMMKVTVDNSAYSISLVKIFGYRRGEIRRLYLDGGFVLVALGAAVCLPLAKWGMDAMYPMLISNVACGMDLTFSPQMYLGIYAGILALYFLINRLLMRRVNRISPVEVLKNRE